jgi:hypothetical protein
LSPAEARVYADEQVGRYRADGLSVSVVDGLAVVGPDDLGLRVWMSAPTVVIQITSQRSQSLVIHVDNAMPGTRIDPGQIDGVPGDRRTRMTFTLALEAGVATEYRVGPSASAPSEDWCFAAIGDVQEAIDGLPDFWPALAQESRLRFVVVPGDLTTRGTLHELNRFKQIIAGSGVPWYATLGNHEVETGDYTRTFGRGSYHFTYGQVAFTFLDLASATLDPGVEPWLDDWLGRAIGKPHVVVGHVPPIDPVATRNAAFSSRLEAHRFLAKLAEGQVDLAVYGHIHSYYAFTHAGIAARITGGGGARPDKLDGIGRHYLRVDVRLSVAPMLATTVRRID